MSNKLYIIALTRWLAEEYAINNGFKRGDVRYISDHFQMAGIVNTQIIVYDGAKPQLVEDIRVRHQHRNITFKMENRNV